MRRLLLPLALLALAACDTGGTEDADGATYPLPGDYPEVNLATLLSAEAGRYNVTGVVTDIFECPPNTACILPDNLTLGDRPPGEAPPQIFVTIYAEQPSQLEISAAYRVSVEVTGEPGTIGRFILLGYERVE